MKLNNFVVCFFIFSFCLVSNGRAGDDFMGANPKGFSGDIYIGGQWMEESSNLKAGDDNKMINALSGSPIDEDEMMPAILFNLKYNFGNKVSIFMETPLDDGPQLELGFALENLYDGELAFSVFYCLPDEVWEDPFMMLQERKSTDKTEYGGKASYDIMGFGIGYKLKFVDVDKDLIGRRTTDLQRDGSIHQFETSYKIEFSEDFFLTPFLGFRMADMDGKSNEYNGYEFGLSVTHYFNDFRFIGGIEGSMEDYDALHPLFEKSRKDNIYAFNGIITWFHPLDFENFSINSGVRYEDIDSDIDFYDANELSVFFAIGYHFGE